MKTRLAILIGGMLGMALLFSHAAPSTEATASKSSSSQVLNNKIVITPEIKKAFLGSDTIEIQEITGTSGRFEVGGTYRVVGVCRQDTFKHAELYIGNSAEAGPAAIVPASGSSLFKDCPTGATPFDVTFTLLRPGLLHATIYDPNRASKQDNSVAGIYLGDVVFKR